MLRRTNAGGKSSCSLLSVGLCLFILLWIPSSCFAATATPRQSKFFEDRDIQRSPAYKTFQTSVVQESSEKKLKTNRRLGVAGNIGSQPPTCRNKCGSCMPCEAIQVPTFSGQRIHLQYANYQPEGWKCKCRDKVFNP